MVEFDTGMIWRRGDVDTEIVGRIVAVRRRNGDRGAEMYEETEIVVAPPALPRPGDLIRLDAVDYRVTESIPHPDLDGVLRGCSCTAVRGEAEFDTPIVRRRRTGSVDGTPVYAETTAVCRVVGRSVSDDGAEKREEVEIVLPSGADLLPEDLVTLAGAEYRVTKSRPHSAAGTTCVLVRGEAEFDTPIVRRRRTGSVDGTPVYAETTAVCRVVGRSVSDDGAEKREEVEIVLPSGADLLPEDLVTLAGAEYRVTKSRPHSAAGGAAGTTGTLTRIVSEPDTPAVWRRHTGSVGGAPVYTDAAVLCRIVKLLRRRGAGDYTGTAEELELSFDAPTEPHPGDLITLDNKDYRVIQTSRRADSDGNVAGCLCSAVR